MTDTKTEAPVRPKTRTATRVIEHDGRRMKVEAVYGLRYHEGQQPYFTLTGSVWYASVTGNFRQEPDDCGQVTDEILAAFPWLSLMARAHLGNAVTGEPLHARANGWFWFNADNRPHDPILDHQWPKGFKGMTPAERAAAYLKVDPSFFEGVSTSAEFDERIDLLRPTWATLARQVIEIYALEVPAELTGKQ